MHILHRCQITGVQQFDRSLLNQNIYLLKHRNHMKIKCPKPVHFFKLALNFIFIMNSSEESINEENREHVFRWR